MNRLIQLRETLRLFGLAHTSIRKEDKFLLPFQNSNSFREYLLSLPDRFQERYPARRVNSIYFDTDGKEMLRQSIDGDTVKLKIRFRWYGNEVTPQAGILELKLKEGELGTKFKKENALFSSLGCNCFRDLNQVFPGILHIRPVVFISYLRSYYQSVCGKLFITLDRDLRASAVECDGQYNTAISLTDSLICELKTDFSEIQQHNLTVLTLPLRKIRLSKYDFSIRALGI